MSQAPSTPVVNGSGSPSNKGTGQKKAIPLLKKPPSAPAVSQAPKPDAAVFHSIAGQLVQVLEPHSEASPMALLVQTLAAFGNCIGRTAHWIHEDKHHYLNLFVALVGTSSKSRKGTSWGRVEKFFRDLDPHWCNYRVKSGVVSGEGLIHEVRDPIYKFKKGQQVLIDPGEQDKRLFCCEEEFAALLKVAQRQGNTTSPKLRDFWDGRQVITTMAKNSREQTTGAHVGVIGHITTEELDHCFSSTEQANGFGNRFLWLAVMRSKALPHGGQPDAEQLNALSLDFKSAIAFAMAQGSIGLDSEADQKWCDVYPKLSEGKSGLAGRLLARAEAQVRRLACIYALLAKSSVVRLPDLNAALAVWKYVEESVTFIFGNGLSDPIAEEILCALKEASPNHMTRNAIRNIFYRNRSSREISRALNWLAANQLAHMKKFNTDGRPVEAWFFGPAPTP